MFIVTGGAGFIGSNLVKELNRRGHTDILVVDDLGTGAKFRNLADLAIADYMDKREFRARVEGGRLGFTPTAILHNGARTDTLEHDGRFMMENNFGDSKVLLHWALLHKVPMVYASSAEIYGASRDFAPEPRNEKPMSVYGYSKLLFDQHVRSLMPHVETPLVGLRLFSVYGAREAHKGPMMSIPHQFLDQLRGGGVCSIFGGCDGFADGEQARDFVHVGDIVDLSLHFALGGMAKGIFNAGTGEATSFNAVAQALIRRLGQGRIEYIPFPEALKGQYQSFTQADLRTLRAAGYTRPFTTLEAGIGKLVEER
jgi:ADP-L-glycero-D-manno-heptose 6-epimerase